MSKTHIIAVVAFTYFVIAAGVMSWFLYMVVASGSVLEEKISLIAQKNAQVQAQTELSRLIESTETERAALTTFVLTEDRTSDFLTGIERVGAGTGVSLTTKSLKVIPQEGAFDTLEIELVVEGNEGAVKNMLTILESLPYHSTMQSLSLSKTGGTVSGTVGLIVTLATYEE